MHAASGIEVPLDLKRRIRVDFFLDRLAQFGERQLQEGKLEHHRGGRDLTLELPRLEREWHARIIAKPVPCGQQAWAWTCIARWSSGRLAVDAALDRTPGPRLFAIREIVRRASTFLPNRNLPRVAAARLSG